MYNTIFGIEVGKSIYIYCIYTYILAILQNNHSNIYIESIINVESTSVQILYTD